MRVGWIGLGNMGLVMAARVLEAGHDLTLYNRSSAKAAALVEQVTGTLEEQHAEDIFLVLARIHVAAQIVAGGEEQGFKTCESELVGGQPGMLQMG